MKMTPLALTGIILWWAEGTKSGRDKRWPGARSYPIELTNTNPSIIKLFVDFLRLELRVPNDRLRVQLQIHEGDNQLQMESFWSDITGVSRQHFNKTIVRPVGNKVGKSNGTCKVRFADKQLYFELETLLEKVLSEIYIDPAEILRTLPHYEMVSKSVRIGPDKSRGVAQLASARRLGR